MSFGDYEDTDPQLCHEIPQDSAIIMNEDNIQMADDNHDGDVDDFEMDLDLGDDDVIPGQQAPVHYVQILNQSTLILTSMMTWIPLKVMKRILRVTVRPTPSLQTMRQLLLRVTVRPTPSL